MRSFAGVKASWGALAALEIEHFPGMVEAEIHRAALATAFRWPLEAILAVHRYGLIFPGEPIVLVITASLHRGEAKPEAKPQEHAATQKWRG